MNEHDALQLARCLPNPFYLQKGVEVPDGRDFPFQKRAWLSGFPYSCIVMKGRIAFETTKTWELMVLVR